MDFNFFLTNNKSGYKTRESWFSKNYPDVYNEIIEYTNKFPFKMSFKEKIWFFFNKLTSRPKCVTCGNDLKFRNRFDKPYGDFCSLKCINENKNEMIRRQKIIFNKKYGINFYTESKDFIKKSKETKLKKYGNANYNNLNKAKETKLKKYNNSNYNNQEKYQDTCMKKYNVLNYSLSNAYQKQLDNNFRKLYPDLNILQIEKYEIEIKCNQCQKNFKLTKQLLYERYKRKHTICLHCNPLGSKNSSSYEKELSTFLTNQKIAHKTNVRNIISKEIDILINNNFGIEINGLYWHNELFIGDDYHLNKTIECYNKGIELIHIFEDEWLFKKPIIKSIILNKLNLSKNRIYARKCYIKEISPSISKEFLNKNHIQGNVNAKIKLGLFYNNELVSVMTFSKGRKPLSGKKYEWELVRFSNKLNTNVIGGANKLFKYFCKKINPTIVISYSDIRLFKGELYKTLGFKQISQSKPNYFYVKGDNRYHRYNFRKSELIKEGYNKNKTEKEIMFERKIYRIYDCGNIRWEYKLPIYTRNY